MTEPQDKTSVANLEEKLAQKAEEVRVLRQVSSEVNATLDLDEIYEIVLRTMDHLFGFHHALILLLDDSGETLKVAASRGYQTPAIGVTVPVGVGVIGMVARRRKMMRVGNLGQYRSYAAAVRSEMEQSSEVAQLQAVPELPGLPDVESQIAIPLLIKDTLVGVFAVESAERRVFTERDETLVTIVANLSASAIHNALLYRRLEQYSESLSEKVKERTRELEEKNEQLEQTLRELNEKEEQLVMQEKLASLGNLAAGVAHEINTPLGALNSNNDTMVRLARKIRSLLEKGENHGSVQTANKIQSFFRTMESLAEFNRTAAQRMIDIVVSLRNFARLDRAAEDEVDIHDGLENALTLLRSQLRDRITVHKDYGKAPPIRCYPSQLNHVYMNLLMNATQAIEDKGDIYLRTYSDENAVIVEIKDTGVGIPASDLKRIFDPGFTTRGVKVGTGLGLAIVRRVVDEHNGRIEVESKVGEGTTMRIFLPTNRGIQQQT